MEKKISKKNIKNGFQICHSLIQRLIKDAELNLKNGRYSSAVALSILAYEELSKGDLLRQKITLGEDLPLNEWKKLSFGNQAHKLKLQWFPTMKKEKVLNKWTDVDIQALREANQKLGFLPDYPNKSALIKEIEVVELINSKLNELKQDCFYLRWDAGNEKWISFDSLFSKKIRNAIARFLILETKQTALLQNFSLSYPHKLVKDWTEDDWKNLRNSKYSKEITKIQKEIVAERKNGNIRLVLNVLAKK